MTTQACLAEIQATAASLFAAGGGGGGGGTAAARWRRRPRRQPTRVLPPQLHRRRPGEILEFT